jgi:hypothetical protein
MSGRRAVTITVASWLVLALIGARVHAAADMKTPSSGGLNKAPHRHKPRVRRDVHLEIRRAAGVPADTSPALRW